MVVIRESLNKSDRSCCEIEFVRFLIEKLAIAVAIVHFYSEKLANYSLRKTIHDLFRASLSLRVWRFDLFLLAQAVIEFASCLKQKDIQIFIHHDLIHSRT